MRLFAPVENIDELTGHDMSVDCGERRKACRRRCSGERRGIHRAHGGNVRRVEHGGEVRAAFLGGRHAVVAPVQLGRGDHVGALGDRLGEKSPRVW